MKDATTTDAVELIRGPERPDAWFRCNACGVRQLRARSMPTGGVTCTACDAPLSASDLIDAAALHVRSIAFVIDALALVFPYVLFGGVTLLASSWVPKDEDGNFTEGARQVFMAAMVVYYATYLVFFECIGRSPGKLALGLRVVRTSDWKAPGVLRGVVRLVGKIVTVVTFGIPALIALWDPLRRTLHDRLAGTIVMQK